MRRAWIAGVLMCVAACASRRADATAEHTGPPATATSDDLFDLERVHHFEIEVADRDWRELNRNPFAKRDVPAIVRFERRQYAASIRYKGANTLFSCFDARGRRICDKLSFMLEFDDRSDPSGFLGLRRLALNSSVRDPSFVREAASYAMFRELGIAAPRTGYATATVNDELHGLFVLVEPIDRRFVRRWWPKGTGNLYKQAWPNHSDSERYETQLRGQRSSPDTSDIESLSEVLGQSLADGDPEQVRGVIDLAELARYYAVDRAIRNFDGPRRFARDPESGVPRNRNYYWYAEPDGAFHLIPWDLDNALLPARQSVFFDQHQWLTRPRDLGAEVWSRAATECRFMTRCALEGQVPCPPWFITEEVYPAECDALTAIAHREAWADYLAALDTLVHGPMAPRALVPRLDRVRAALRPVVAADPRGPGLEQFERANEEVDWTIGAQVEAARSFLAMYPEP